VASDILRPSLFLQGTSVLLHTAVERESTRVARFCGFAFSWALYGSQGSKCSQCIAWSICITMEHMINMHCMDHKGAYDMLRLKHPTALAGAAHDIETTTFCATPKSGQACHSTGLCAQGYIKQLLHVMGLDALAHVIHLCSSTVGLMGLYMPHAHIKHM
jgi:hypothetical protein